MKKSRFLGIIFLCALYITTLFIGGKAEIAPAPNADKVFTEVIFSIAAPSVYPTGGNIVPASEANFTFQVYSKSTNPFIPENNILLNRSGSIKSNVLQANAASFAIPIVHDPLPVFHRNLRC